MDAVTAIEAAARAAKRAFGIPHTVWEVEYSPTHKAIMIRERHEGRRPPSPAAQGGVQVIDLWSLSPADAESVTSADIDRWLATEQAS